MYLRHAGLHRRSTGVINGIEREDSALDRLVQIVRLYKNELSFATEVDCRDRKKMKSLPAGRDVARST